MPGLTSETKILAFSKGCPRQIVRYFPIAIHGFQCHPEPMKQNIQEMITHCPEDLAPGLYVQSANQLLAHDFDPINGMMLKIMDNYRSMMV